MTITETTARQARALGLTGTQLVAVDDNTLRIVKARVNGKKLGARGAFVNVDIRLEPSDTYTIEYYHIDVRTLDVWMNTYENVYADALADVVGSVQGHHARM